MCLLVLVCVFTRACLQVVYGADKQSWSGIRTALRKGEAKDGDVTLILERRIRPATTQAAAAAASTPAAAAAAGSSFDSRIFASPSNGDDSSANSNGGDNSS